MLVRILTGVIAMLVFLPFLIFSGTIAYPIIMALCALFAVYELIRCVGLHKNLFVSLPLCAAALASPILLRVMGIETTLTAALAAALVLMLYYIAVAVFSRGKVAITNASAVLLVGLYIIAGFSAMVYLRDFREGEKYLYLLVFIGAWIPDTFAYFTGRLFGRHKLIPDVSPKKTVEGAIGGAVFCVLAFVGFALIYNRFELNTCLCGYVHKLPVLLMAVIGLLTAIVSMIGDLAMSVIKRHFGIKDYGKLLPGHGGILDRFDSVIAVAIILAVAFGAANAFDWLA